MSIASTSIQVESYQSLTSKNINVDFSSAKRITFTNDSLATMYICLGSEMGYGPTLCTQNKTILAGNLQPGNLFYGPIFTFGSISNTADFAVNQQVMIANGTTIFDSYAIGVITSITTNSSITVNIANTSVYPSNLTSSYWLFTHYDIASNQRGIVLQPFGGMFILEHYTGTISVIHTMPYGTDANLCIEVE